MTSSVKDKIPLVVAVILGLLSIIAIHKYIQKQVDIPEGKKARIVVARASLKQGVEIGQGDLGTKVIPISALSSVNIEVPMGDTPDVKRQIARITNSMIGRKPTRNISVGEPIYWNDLKITQNDSLSRILPKNRRAVALSVDQVTSVGYNITPGDHVDVVATLEPQNLAFLAGKLTRVAQAGADTKLAPSQQTDKGPVTRVLMQDVEVLAVGQNYSGSGYLSQKEAYSTITLKTTLEEAVMLTHVRSQGQISFILRQRRSLHRLKAPGYIEVTDDNMRQNINILDDQRAKAIEKSTVIDEETKKDALQNSSLIQMESQRYRERKLKKDNKAKSIK